MAQIGVEIQRHRLVEEHDVAKAISMHGMYGTLQVGILHSPAQGMLPLTSSLESGAVLD